MTETTTVLDGVEHDLRAMTPELAASGLAGSARALAREMDDAETSATAKAACGRSLLATLRELRSLAPVAEELDELDELTRRRGRANG